jgi:integrase
MMTAKLLRGANEVKYKNKDGTTVIKYRVRINRKGFELNKLVDSIELANEIINFSKTKAGQSQLKELMLGEVKEAKVNIGQLHRTFKSCLETYNRHHYQKVGNDMIDKKNNATYDNLVKTITETRIEDWREFENLPPIVQAQYSATTSIQFGALDPFEMQSSDIVYYIKARSLAGIKASTIIRELSIISSFFNNFHTYTNDEYLPLSYNNPVPKAKKVSHRTLTGAFIKRERRLSTDEENRLMESLEKARNPEVLFITELSLLTGMRRSEVLTLTKGQFKDGYIELTRTKNGRPRKVSTYGATHLVKAILEYEPNKDLKSKERVFRYTIDGFKSVWQRIIQRANIEDFTFHDLRSEFISRALEKGFNEYIVSELANISNQDHFNKTHLRQHLETARVSNGTTSASDTQHNAGHETAKMTKHYARGLVSKK